MTEVYAAIVGAILAGAVQLTDKIVERRRRQEALLVALASEIKAITDLIRHQGYFDSVRAYADSIREGSWEGYGFVVDIRSDYFIAFHSLASELGCLKPHHVAKIVAFYSFCKSAIDSTRPDGPFAGADRGDPDLRENLLNLEGTMAAVLILGDQISTFPKTALSSVLD